MPDILGCRARNVNLDVEANWDRNTRKKKRARPFGSLSIRGTSRDSNPSLTFVA